MSFTAASTDDMGGNEENAQAEATEPTADTTHADAGQDIVKSHDVETEKYPRPTASQAIVVSGRLERPPAPRIVKILLGITGISLLIYLGKLFTRFVLGMRRTGKLTLRGDRVHLESETRMVGRAIRTSAEHFARRDVLSVRFETRYPYLLTLLGLTSLGVGVIAGVLLILDGLQGEFTAWILSGVGILVAGIVLDLVFTTIATSLPGQVGLELYLPGKRTLRLVGCDAKKAEAVIKALTEVRE